MRRVKVACSPHKSLVILKFAEQSLLGLCPFQGPKCWMKKARWQNAKWVSRWEWERQNGLVSKAYNQCSLPFAFSGLKILRVSSLFLLFSFFRSLILFPSSPHRDLRSFAVLFASFASTSFRFCFVCSSINFQHRHSFSLCPLRPSLLWFLSPCSDKSGLRNTHRPCFLRSFCCFCFYSLVLALSLSARRLLTGPAWPSIVLFFVHFCPPFCVVKPKSAQTRPPLSFP